MTTNELNANTKLFWCVVRNLSQDQHSVCALAPSLQVTLQTKWKMLTSCWMDDSLLTGDCQGVLEQGPQQSVRTIPPCSVLMSLIKKMHNQISDMVQLKRSGHNL